MADIDKQLYKKYGLSSEEQTFIEGMIKEMEQFFRYTGQRDTKYEVVKGGAIYYYGIAFFE